MENQFDEQLPTDLLTYSNTKQQLEQENSLRFFLDFWRQK